MDCNQVLDKLEKGELRAAVPLQDGTWKSDVEVKKAILAVFKEGHLKDCDGIYQGFVDKDNLIPRAFNSNDQVRLVPGGSSVRRGAYIASNVVIMPPSYINVGAYVDEGSMIDSHVLVGSCAQVGKNVHLSAGVQIGGVLEPVGMTPVIVEDNVFVGAGAVIVEGILVKKEAVIAPGVVLSKAVPIYDCVNEVVLEKGAPIPERAVIVPGTRPINTKWGKSKQLNVACPIIIKYRDKKSDAALTLEECLRSETF